MISSVILAIFLFAENDHSCAANMLPPELNVTEEYIDVSPNTELSLQCIGISTMMWEFKYPTEDEETLNSTIEWKMDSPRGTVFKSIITLNLTDYRSTGKYTCLYSNDKEQRSASLHVFVHDSEKLLLPMHDYQAVREGDMDPIPCLAINSEVKLTLWKGECDEEKVPTTYVSYNRTVGFVTINATSYFEEEFCCTAEFNGREETFPFNIEFYSRTTSEPDVRIIEGRNLSILVNSTLSLKCVVFVEENTLFEAEWIHPVIDVIRVSTMPPTLNEEIDGYKQYIKPLTVFNAQRTDSGVYSCNVEDHSYRRNSAEVKILVLDPEEPHFTETRATLTEVTGIPGEKVELLCHDVKGSPKPEMTWYRDRLRLDGTNGTHINFSNDKKILIIDRLHQKDAGVYQCWAENDYGVASRNITLLLQSSRDPEKPHFTENRANLTEIIGIPGEKVQLLCYDVKGFPKPEMKWYRDGVRLDGSNRTDIRFSDDKKILIIDRLHQEDAGIYMCWAENDYGVASRNITLFLQSTGGGFSGKLNSKQMVTYTVAAIGGLLIVLLLFLFLWNIYWRKKQKKILQFFYHNTFQEGQMPFFNPDLPIDEQVEVLPYDERWEFPEKNLKLGRVLGQGAFGRVIKAEAIGLNDREKQTVVAVKMLKERANIDQQKSLMAELKILIHLGHHVNIVNLLGAVTKKISKGELMVLVEYCRYGNLRDYLLTYRHKFVLKGDLPPDKTEYVKRYLRLPSPPRSEMLSTETSQNSTWSLLQTSETSISNVSNRSYGLLNSPRCSGLQATSVSIQDAENISFSPDEKEQTVTTTDLICYSFQCARGMDYLASRKLIHRDLAARNVLLADNNTVKICDFGLAKNCYRNSSYVKKGNIPLPIKWMAPESLEDNIFTVKSDVWSYGVLLWEFFTLGGNPYPGIQIDEGFHMRLKLGYRMRKPELAPAIIYQIMTSCWNSNPEGRPDFLQLSTALGELLEPGIKQHFIDLNEPYTDMNQSALSHNYLNVMKSGTPKTCEGNTKTSKAVNDYDAVPPVKYKAHENNPGSPMEVVPMIHFNDEDSTSSQRQ